VKDLDAAQTPLSSDWDFWRQGLDRKYFTGVFKWSSIIGVAAALAFLGFEKRPIALGMVCGLVVGLFSLWTVQATVKLLFRGGGFAGLKLAVAALLKMPFLGAGLLVVSWAGDKGYINIFAVVCGVLLVHGTMIFRAIGTAMAHADTTNDWFK